MIPASAEFDVPGADDPAILADILATLGRDAARCGRHSTGSRASPDSRSPLSIRRGGRR
jgi:hypothetical protein